MILHFADVHLGNYRMPIRDYILEAMREIVDIADRERPKLITFGGDAFVHCVPPAADVDAFGGFLRDLATIAPVVAIPGNHDLAGRGATAIDVYDHIDNVHVYKEPGVHHHADIRITVVPWLPQKALIGSESTYKAMETLLDLLKPRRGDPSVLLAHCTALGTELNDAATTMMTNDVLWPSSWFEPYDVALLGHLHRCQVVPGAPRAFYPGCVCPTRFSEMGQKYVILYYDTVEESIPLSSPPDLVQIDAAKLPESSISPHDFVQIVKDHGTPDPEGIPECAWYEIKTRPAERERRVRLEDVDASALSPAEAIAAWLEAEGKSDMVENVYALAQELMEAK